MVREVRALFLSVCQALFPAGFNIHPQAVLHRGEREGEGIILIGQAIFFQRQCAPTIDATQAHLHLVDEDVGQVGLLHFVGVALDLFRAFVQGLDGVVQG